MIPIHENVPDDLVPVYPCPALDAKLEQVYIMGGGVGANRAQLQVMDDHDDAGKIVGTIFCLRVPFDGYFLHELKRTDEVRTQPLMASPYVQAYERRKELPGG